MLDVLTTRQERVLALSADGWSVKEIAHRMGITYWTAKKHRDAAVERLHAANVAHAVAIYVRASKRRQPRPAQGQMGLDLG